MLQMPDKNTQKHHVIVLCTGWPTKNATHDPKSVLQTKKT